jgi:hypothetical protein
MKKLRLDADSLRVESFTPREPVAETGTVRAHGTWDTCIDVPCDPDLSIDPCGPAPTAAATCGYTCGYTCSCGCNYTRVGWTCDPYASECLPVPEQ